MFKQTILIVLLTIIFIVLYNGYSDKAVLAHSKYLFSATDTANDKPAEEVYKNIQVLKGMPSSKLHTVMRFITNSLGVHCDFCHVKGDKGPWPMEKDDKKEKQTAREMITMMNNINRDNFDGRQEVSCATCHNGSPKPVSYAPLMTEKNDIRVNKDSLPDVNTIIDKYLNAVGGKTSFDKFKTRITKGETTTSNGMKEQVQIQQTAPDKYVIQTSSEQGISLEGYNGTQGWVKFPYYSGVLDEDDVMDVKKSGQFYKEINITGYTKMKVSGMQKIVEHKAYELRGMDNLGNFVKVYFDTESGLLLKEIYYKPNPFGSIPVEISYDDYRDVDGVKLPYTIITHTTSSLETLKVTEIKNNVSIDDENYNMPPEEHKEMKK